MLRQILFIYLSNKQFQKLFPRIFTATKSKEAWDALQIGYQGSTKVLNVKLQALHGKFEVLFMKENDCLHNYFYNMLGIVNQIQKYGE